MNSPQKHIPQTVTQAYYNQKYNNHFDQYFQHMVYVHINHEPSEIRMVVWFLFNILNLKAHLIQQSFHKIEIRSR